MKRMLIFIFAFMLILPNTVLAHSKLTASTPSADSTVNTVPGQVEMTFNTDIESLSNFKLFNAAGEQIETGKASVNGATMTGALPPDLANGVYTVKWTIIGADSHSVEGEFSFTVDAPVTSPSPEASPSPDSAEASGQPAASAEPSPTVEPSPSADAAQADDTGNENDGNGSALTPILIIAGIIVIAAVIITLSRRRKS
ncbi:copper resistance CopC family protein [Paenibacillus nanensis]|nr:copper resistance protein CopC [Paenibacillus nanensis]